MSMGIQPALSAAAATDPQQPDSPVKTPESAGRLVVIAVGWMLLAIALPAAMGFLRGFVPSFIDAATHGKTQLQIPPAFDHFLTAAYIFASAAVLLSASLVRGPIVGDGDRPLGLGLAPIARLPVTIALLVLVAAYGGLLDYAIYEAKPDVYVQAFSDPLWVSLFNILALVVLAPLGEELFFRGWLWTGLRKHWSVLPTALLTAATWLVLHLNVIQIVVLLFPALLISVARCASKSVRSTILIHAVYNLSVNVPVVGLVLHVLKN